MAASASSTPDVAQNSNASNASAVPRRTQVGVQVKLETFTYADAQAIRATGFSFVRFGIWTNALGNVAYRQRMLAAFAAARSAALPVLVTLRSTQPLTTAPRGQARDAALALAGTALADAVIEIGREFAAQILAIELWNEPDLARYWPTGDVLATFAPTLRATCTRLATQPHPVPVYGFGFARAPLRGTLPDTLLTAVLDGNAGCLDALSYHAYGMTPAAIRDAAREIRMRHGIPAVITEWGVPSAGLLQGSGSQARRMRDFAATLMDSQTSLISIYEWKDTASGTNARERSYGLVDSSGQPKPALDIWRQTLRAR
jgi:hypothetical protein